MILVASTANSANALVLMIPLEEALAILEPKLQPWALERQTMSVCEALGRVLASDQRSLLDLPSLDKAALDAYARAIADPHSRLRLREMAAAGSVPLSPRGPGTATKITTGAPVRFLRLGSLWR